MNTIEVTGTAERSITPDEIIFSIAIEEYWEEEFKGMKYEDYKTKVAIEVVEESLMQELASNGFEMKDITLKRTGNSYRQRGKDFLMSKTVEISIPDFAKANDLSNKLQTRGIRNMSIARLKHVAIEKIKLEVQGESVSNALVKAEYLAAIAGKEVQNVISIVEIDQNAGIIPRPQAYARGASLMKSNSGGGGTQYENFQLIEVKAQVRVLYEIE